MTSEQIPKVAHADARFVKDLAKRSWAKPTVVRHNYARRWDFATKDHVTACLPLKHETDSLKSLPTVTP
jgi:hypothetical protein